MGGNTRQQKQIKKSISFSLFSFLKPRHKAYPEDDVSSPRALKVYPSDSDQGRYVAEPGIDRKASAFIKKFHERSNNDSWTLIHITSYSSHVLDMKKE